MADFNYTDRPSGEVGGSFEPSSHDFTEYQLLAERQYYMLYRARRNGRYYVLKALRPEYRDNAARIEWLCKEYSIGRSLQHSNIVHVEGLEDDPVVGRCIVMEYIEGVTLDVWVSRHRDISQRREVLRQLLVALDYCHCYQVCHRDVKPSNVMVTTESNQVKLIDFGLSDGPQYAAFKQSAGSDGWASPEQTAGLPAHATDDIYAVGRIIKTLMPHQFRRAARHATQRLPERRPPTAMALSHLLESRWPLHLAVALMTAIVLLIACYFALRVTDSQYDAVLPSGQTVRYRIVSHIHRQVALTAFAEGTEASGPMVIPATLRHRHLPYSVVAIDNAAFANSTGLTSLQLPEGLQRIEDEAFRGCKHLCDTLFIPCSLRWIGIDAFRSCSSLPAVVWNAQCCDGERRDYNYCFSECRNLHSVSVGDGVTTLPEALFGFIENLQQATLPPSLTHIPDRLFESDNQLSHITLPDSLRSIGNKAFSACRFSQLDFPATLQTIGSEAFMLVPFRTVNLGPNISYIGDKAFYLCMSLQTVRISAPTPPEIGTEAFASISSQKPPALVVPKALIDIYRQASGYDSVFSEITDGGKSSLMAPTNPQSHSSTRTRDGGKSSLMAPTNPSQTKAKPLTSGHAPYPLPAIAYEKGVRYLSDTNYVSYPMPAVKSFVNADGKTLYYQAVPRRTGVIAIVKPSKGWGSVGDPEGRIVIPAVITIDGTTYHVVKIQPSAFAGCSKITSVVIEKGIRYISSRAFADCTSLASVSIPDDCNIGGSDAFANTPSLASICLPAIMKEVPVGTFEGSGLRQVQMHEGLESIRQNAFANCRNLREIHFPESLKRIEIHAFHGCTSLETYTTAVSNSLYIQSDAFSDCPNAQSHKR